MMQNRLFAAWLRPVAGLFALVAVLALGACGGGSGSPNNPYAPVTVIPALTVIPVDPTIYSGVASSLTISGGVPPYRAFSNNTAVLPVTQAVSGSTVALLATTVSADTTASVTIQDSAGTSIAATVTIRPGPASPPPALSVLPSAIEVYSTVASSVAIIGGVAPFRAYSTNGSVLPVSQVVTGSTVQLTAAAVTADTSVLLTILDAVGQTVVANVTVHPKPTTPPPALSVLPVTADIYSGIPSSLTVVGGVAPYRAFSSNSAVLPVTQAVAGSTVPLAAASVSANTPVVVTVQDSAGQTAIVNVLVHPGATTPVPVLTVLPSTVDVYSLIDTPLTVSSGVAPFRAFSSNPAVLPVTQIVTSNTIPLLAVNVSANTAVVVTVLDAVGQTATVNVTVRPGPVSPPPALVVLPNDVVTSKGVPFTLTISGGLAPFKAYSSNPGVVPVGLSVAGRSLVATANSVNVDTNVLITVQDSAGQTAKITVLVQADPAMPPPTLTVLPSAAVVFSGVPSVLTVTGGVPPYLAFSSNSATLPVAQAVSGGAIPLFAARVAADTSVTITVQDSAAKTATSAVTVKPAALLNNLTIKPNAADCGTTAICAGQTGTATITALLPSGGPAAGRQIRFDVVAGPYAIVSNGTAVQTLTVTSDAAGNAQVIVRANVDAPTQPAQIRATDVASGEQITGDFLIQQRTDGSTILTIVPDASTIKGAYIGECSIAFRIDYYIYGGTPPYRITQNFPDASVIVNPVVNASGSYFEVITNGSCVDPQIFSILDATGRQTTAKLFNLAGDVARPVVPVTVSDLVIVPGDQTGACGNVALTYSYVVTGGTPPYNVSASPKAGLYPTLSTQIISSNGGTVAITNVTQNVTLSFIDSSKPKKTLSRTITCTGGPGPVALTASASFDYTAASCVGQTSNFVITGGVPPYAVQFAPAPPFGSLSTNSVAASGGGFAVTGLHDTSGGGAFLTYVAITDTANSQVVRSISCP